MEEVLTFRWTLIHCLERKTNIMIKIYIDIMVSLKILLQQILLNNCSLFHWRYNEYPEVADILL